MQQEPSPGPTPGSNTMLQRESNCPPLRGDNQKNVTSEPLDASKCTPTSTEVQHPKPLPTPDEHGVFKSSSDLKRQSVVEAKECSKGSKDQLVQKDANKEPKNVEEEKEIVEEE